MIHVPGPKRLVLAAAMLSLTTLAVAAIIPRDLPKQLELIDVNHGGVVIYGTIIDSKIDASVPDSIHPWTVLTVEVNQAIAPTTTSGNLTVYVPGAGDIQLSISPPETETRKGEKVVMFLNANPAIQAHAKDAYQIASFAEIFRTQSNRKGDVIVLGEGSGSAIETNTKLSELSSLTVKVYESLVTTKQEAK